MNVLDDNLVYGLTEEQHTKLYQVRHLASVLADLSLSSYPKTDVQLNPESLGVVFALLRDNLSIEIKSL